MMQESNLVLNIQPSAFELNLAPQPSAKLINYSSSARLLSPSSTRCFSKSAAEIGTKELLQKCVRRGDKVYRVNPEHINMFESKTPVDAQINSGQRKASLESPVDKVQSGESLYKTFSFEQSANDEDTEKCIAFWRSVMDKNLAAIKCSIIEQTQSGGSLGVEVPPVDSQESLRTEIANLHDDYKVMVQSVLRDLQKKRLHEIKMYGARCRLCESLSSSVGDSDKASSIDVQAVIAELDNWSPDSSKKKGTRQEKSKKVNKKESFGPSERNGETSSTDTRQEKSKKVNKKESFGPSETNGETSSTDTRQENSKKVNKKESFGPSERNGETSSTDTRQEKSKKTDKSESFGPSEKSAAETSEKSAEKTDGNSYKHVDVIDEKTKTGAYAAWRKNQVEEPCPCENLNCDCNTNPAIISVQVKTSSSGVKM